MPPREARALRASASRVGTQTALACRGRRLQTPSRRPSSATWRGRSGSSGRPRTPARRCRRAADAARPRGVRFATYCRCTRTKPNCSQRRSTSPSVDADQVAAVLADDPHEVAMRLGVEDRAARDQAGRAGAHVCGGDHLARRAVPVPARETARCGLALRRSRPRPRPARAPRRAAGDRRAFAGSRARSARTRRRPRCRTR